MRRPVATTAVVLICLTGCTVGADQPDPSRSAPQASSRASTATGPCTAATAKAGRQAVVSATGFQPTCAKVAVGMQFFLVNDTDKAQSLRTKKGSPESFHVDLPKRTSTYARDFKQKGTYVIEQAGGGVPLTIVVV